MIQLDQHEGSYLSICKHYRAIYDTPCIQAESEKWQQVKKYYIQNVCIFMWQIPISIPDQFTAVEVAHQSVVLGVFLMLC